MIHKAVPGYHSGAQETNGNHRMGDAVYLKGCEDWRVARLVEFLNIQDGRLGWDLDRVAEQLELGITGSHAAKLFNRHIGIGVREYAKQRRLTLAARQLRTTTESVKRIALDLGYRTPNDLRRQFRRMFQQSPTEFRNAERTESSSSRNVVLAFQARKP
jgi:AraC-like DNA-binding protein